MDDKQIQIKVMTGPILASRELIEDSQILPPGVNIFDHLAELRRQFEALPPEEHLAEDEERRAREKAERTCPHCGCDPDEHGDD